uniref:Uncharacterized protein n=1 Tax=Rhizophora mucronata TaxID=61149 RepID=A0A2P2MNM9_RHIMU
MHRISNKDLSLFTENEKKKNGMIKASRMDNYNFYILLQYTQTHGQLPAEEIK